MFYSEVFEKIFYFFKRPLFIFFKEIQRGKRTIFFKQNFLNFVFSKSETFFKHFL